MIEPKSVEEILDFAIDEESKAEAFYKKLAANMQNEDMRNALLGFAEEEAGHKKKLENIKEIGFELAPQKEEVQDLKISDYTVSNYSFDNLDYQGALIFAMKKEKAAYRLYMALSNMTEVPELKQTLLGLAQEEAKHKLRFEVEYDELILVEN